MSQEKRLEVTPSDTNDPFDREMVKNAMLAHLDGVYKFSARADCDELVTALIRSWVAKNQALKSVQAELAALDKRISDSHGIML